jgi:hypothetical protein
MSAGEAEAAMAAGVAGVAARSAQRDELNSLFLKWEKLYELFT